MAEQGNVKNGSSSGLGGSFVEYRTQKDFSSETDDDDNSQKGSPTGGDDSLKRMLTQMFQKMNENINDKIEENISKVNDKIEENISKVNNKLEENKVELNENISKVNNRLENIETSLKEQIKELSLKQGDLGAHFTKECENIRSEVAEKNTKTTQEITKIKADVVQVQQELNHVECKFENFNANLKKNTQANERKYDNYLEEIEKMREEALTQKHLIKTLESKLVGGQVINTAASVNLHNTEGLPKFYGLSRENPVAFLRTLKSYLSNLDGEFARLQVARNCIRDNALVWFDMVSDEIVTFAEFENLFLRQYWGQSQQRRLRHDLSFGHYQGNMSRENYVIRKYSMLKYIEPSIQQNDIVIQLAHHFGERVVQAVALQGLETIEQLLNLVKRLDDVDSGNWNASNPQNKRGFVGSRPGNNDHRNNSQYDVQRGDGRLGHTHDNNKNNYAWQSKNYGNKREQFEDRTQPRKNDKEVNVALVREYEKEENPPIRDSSRGAIPKMKKKTTEYGEESKVGGRDEASANFY